MASKTLPTTLERIIREPVPAEMASLPDPKATRDRLAHILTDRNIEPELRGAIAAGLIAAELAYMEAVA